MVPGCVDLEVHVLNVITVCCGQSDAHCCSIQVSLPVARVDGCPVGLGLIGPRGSDEALLRLTEQLEPLLCTL